ncbi:hypothetical protein BaRGS_00019312 [Batillaria attramentaria]|uniref:Uncharacterized protein n=1 Tax=Batillaria attramentaria TaxID=370345 RepID=A0ABD0KRN4_9CAEN
MERKVKGAKNSVNQGSPKNRRDNKEKRACFCSSPYHTAIFITLKTRIIAVISKSPSVPQQRTTVVTQHSRPGCMYTPCTPRPPQVEKPAMGRCYSIYGYLTSLTSGWPGRRVPKV